MPHVESRPACRVSKDLVTLRVWEVIDNDVRLRISCDNCQHEAVWTTGYMQKRLKRVRGATMFRLGMQLRCGGCRSNYLHIMRG
jgi:hypothetical protein